MLASMPKFVALISETAAVVDSPSEHWYVAVGILKSWPRCSTVPDKVQLKPLSLYAKVKVSVLAVGCEKPTSGAADLGLRSRVAEIPDSEIGHDRGEIFVNQFRLAPSIASSFAEPNPQSAEIQEVEREEGPEPACCRDHHRENRYDRT